MKMTVGRLVVSDLELFSQRMITFLWFSIDRATCVNISPVISVSSPSIVT